MEGRGRGVDEGTIDNEVKERKGVKRKASDALHECGILVEYLQIEES